MSEEYAAQLRGANPTFVGFAAGSQRNGIEITGARHHDRGATSKNGREIAPI
jgi:hypothetical protein